MASPVTLNVGGTKFITSASTLTNNSAYFDSLLSGNWADSQQEIFLDRNPNAFAKLLDYMRDNTIKVEDIDTTVLSLAEFLGIERLILAVKIRWYINIGKGPVVQGDEQIAEAFDKEYGGISKAISSGLFPYFFKQDGINCEKDMVVVSTHNVGLSLMFQPSTIQITEATKPQISVQGREDASPILDAGEGSIVGALNWLHRNGYTTYEQQMSRSHDWGQQVTFSRRKHNAMTCNAIDIFIPAEDEQPTNLPIKQFALLLEDTDEDEHQILAPAQFSEDPDVREAEFGCEEIEPPRDDDGRCMLGWLERNGFVTHEQTYDEIFRPCIKLLVRSYYSEDSSKQKGRLYSRNI